MTEVKFLPPQIFTFIFSSVVAVSTSLGLYSSLIELRLDDNFIIRRALDKKEYLVIIRDNFC